MAGLQLWVVTADTRVAVTMDVDATIRDLYIAAKEALSLRGRLLYQGEPLEVSSMSLSDTGLSSQAAVHLVKPSRQEALELGQKLQRASLIGDMKSVVDHLMAGADPSFVNLDGSGETARHVASYAVKYPEVMRALIAAGASVNGTTREGDTPLHFAAREFDTRSVDRLVTEGAQLDAQNAYGDTPLHDAAERGCSPIVDALIRAGAKLDLSNKKGDQPLHRAAFRNHKAVVEALVAAAAPVNRRALQIARGVDFGNTIQEAEVVDVLERVIARSVPEGQPAPSVPLDAKEVKTIRNRMKNLRDKLGRIEGLKERDPSELQEDQSKMLKGEKIFRREYEQLAAKLRAHGID